MLTVCQSLCGRKEEDFVPQQEKDGNAGTLRFLDTGVGLQWLAQTLRQSFKLIIVSALA